MDAATGSGRAAGAGAGDASECEGEDQEDSASSHSPDGLDQAFGNLNFSDDNQVKANEADLLAFRQQWQRELDATPSPRRERQLLEIEHLPEDCKPDASEDELSAFRTQWQRELEGSPSPQKVTPKPTEEPQTDHERAKYFFLRAVEYERGGKLYEAVQHYKRAIQIQPDIEARLYESSELRTDTPEGELEKVQAVQAEPVLDEDGEDFIEGEDLSSRFQRILGRNGSLFEQQFPSQAGHISWLPYEVVQLIARWVVSAELDAVSLERLAATSRGLYVAAREPDLWRSLCVRTWGIECGTPRALGLPSWRQMYIQRPRLQLNGCYISKTTYLRPGETSFQDQSYRPWYLIEYYRYLRFFPEGVVLFWTCAEEPAGCVQQLRARSPRPGLGIMRGHYRLLNDKVVMVVKKIPSDKKAAQASSTRFKARRKEPADTFEQTFHMELELRAMRSRRNHQLWWVRYAALCRRDQWSQFELTPQLYPPFLFSRVRAYTAESSAPLPFTHAYA